MLKSLSSRRCAIALAALLCVCSFSPSLWAQERTNSSIVLLDLSQNGARKRFEELAPGTTTQISIPIRNVRASLMAYWLDPANHPTPIDLQLSSTLAGTNPYMPNNQEEPRLPGSGKGPVGLKLPEGVTRIVAIDPKNSLTAFGTKEGLQALDNLVKTIDVPLRQYEIEAQFIELPRANLPKMGLKFVTSPHYFGGVAIVTNNLHPILSQMLEKRSAKVLTAPRLTVIDGLNGQLEQSTIIPLDLETGNTSQGAQKTPSTVAFLKSSTSLRVMAAQTKEGLISLDVTPTLGNTSISVSTTVRDGQSFAIQLSEPKEKQQVVVVVTLRRIRRIGEEQ